MNLTTGRLVDLLSAFPENTPILVGCDNCKYGASGTEDIVRIVPYLNQTFGYVELRLNSVWMEKKLDE